MCAENASQVTPEPGAVSTYLRAAKTEDMPLLRELARISYAPSLLRQCLATLAFHEQCLKYGLDDGRTMFVYEHGGQDVGGCGLHHFIWGPPDVCWASWFFVAPQFRQPTIALGMLYGLLHEARSRGYGRIYIETPTSDPDYARVATYLPRAGFTLEARIVDFYAMHIDQLIFRLDLGGNKTAGVTAKASRRRRE